MRGLGGSVVVAAAVALTLSAVACSSAEPPPGPRRVVRFDPGVVEGVLAERSVGFSLDTAQLSGGMWWRAGSEERQPAATPDLESPKLLRLASSLAPSLLRVGGTDCDAVYFCPTAGPCELPESYRDAYTGEDRRETVLTQEAVRRVGAFAAAVDAEVLFCVNMGPGPRDPVTGEWRPDDARRLIRFARALPAGERFAWWEPGNEINVASFHFALPAPLDARRFADDVEALTALVAAEAPGARVVAPGSYVSPYGEVPELTAPLLTELAGRGAATPDIVSWHLYATQSSSCPLVVHPAGAEKLFDEDRLQEVRGLAGQVRRAAGDRPVWNTESASAQCGGQAGVSDTQLDALWYADWLGVMAQEGTRLVVRHSLVGADYSLLAPETFAPRPTFLALALLRRTVARARLHTEVDRRLLKAHAFCAAGAGGRVALVLANPSDGAVVVDAGAMTGRIVAGLRWRVESPGGLAGTEARLNGEPVGADGTVPEPGGEPVALREGRAWVEVGPAALVVVVLELDPPASGCP